MKRCKLSKSRYKLVQSGQKGHNAHHDISWMTKLALLLPLRPNFGIRGANALLMLLTSPLLCKVRITGCCCTPGRVGDEAGAGLRVASLLAGLITPAGLVRGKLASPPYID
eukprot:4994677-Pleurochrysis_carterae.AAC.1